MDIYTALIKRLEVIFVNRHAFMVNAIGKNAFFKNEYCGTLVWVLVKNIYVFVMLYTAQKPGHVISGARIVHIMAN